MPSQLLKRPKFWDHPSWISTFLLPCSWCYYGIKLLSDQFKRPYNASVPVMCIGNATAGGAGKTPTAIAIAKYYLQQQQNIMFVTRGYGGTIKGPHHVQPDDSASLVGDEALLLQTIAPTIVAKNRKAGIQHAETLGASLIIMDDGLQNISVAKDISILVLDGHSMVGNGRLLPAGPLREPLKTVKNRVDVLVVIDQQHQVPTSLESLPTIQATIHVSTKGLNKKQAWLAFSGIGRPEKFFHTLKQHGFNVVETLPFADHYPYQPQDMDLLKILATKDGASLITTEKDFVRLPKDSKKIIKTLPIHLTFENEKKLYSLFKRLDL